MCRRPPALLSKRATPNRNVPGQGRKPTGILPLWPFPESWALAEHSRRMSVELPVPLAGRELRQVWRETWIPIIIIALIIARQPELWLEAALAAYRDSQLRLCPRCPGSQSLSASLAREIHWSLSRGSELSSKLELETWNDWASMISHLSRSDSVEY